MLIQHLLYIIQGKGPLPVGSSTF